MTITFPQMGNIEYMLTDLLDRLEVDYLVPPQSTTKTLQLGLKYSPEFACLPLKVTLGNFIEALEAGADTVIMAGGVGPCRFGYYAQVQERILRQAGYDFEMIVFEPARAGVMEFVSSFRRVAPGKSMREIWQAVKTSFFKAQSIDYVERACLATRGLEVNRGDTTLAWKEGLAILKRAHSRRDIEEARDEALGRVAAVAKDTGRRVLRVGVVGEFYILLEPFVNFGIEEYLGNREVVVDRSVYVTDWVGPSKDNPVSNHAYEEIERAAAPYLAHSVGGEGQASVGHTVIYGREEIGRAHV